MAHSHPASVTDVYAEYIRLRRDGQNLEAAAHALTPMVETLDKSGHTQLKILIEQWEASESLHARMELSARVQPQPENPAPEPEAGMPPPRARSSVIQRIASPPRPAEPASPPASNLIRPIGPRPTTTVGTASDVAPTPGKIFCPHCGKPNNQGDNYCYACGHVLAMQRTGETQELDDDSALEPEVRWGSAYFGPGLRLVLMVRGGAHPLEFAVDKEMVLGRFSPGHHLKPDIDLAPYDAENLGVSRLHALIRRDDNTVHLVDLSSRNHTFVNGQRLFPREVRALHNGDEIRLGRLPIRVLFRAESG